VVMCGSHYAGPDPGQITVLWVKISMQNQPPSSNQASHPSMCMHTEYQQKLGSKRILCDALVHVRGLAVLADVWLRTS